MDDLKKKMDTFVKSDWNQIQVQVFKHYLSVGL